MIPQSLSSEYCLHPNLPDQVVTSRFQFVGVREAKSPVSCHVVDVLDLPPSFFWLPCPCCLQSPVSRWFIFRLDLIAVCS